jgi:hypothetical protein
MTAKQVAIKDIKKDDDFAHPILILREKELIEFLIEYPQDLITTNYENYNN